MRHRVFIAINLPDNIRKKLYETRDEYPDLPCRWTKKDNLHLTLLFLGYVTDQEILDICQTTREIAKQHKSFSLELNRIVYGPPRKQPPRMIWVEGQSSTELGNLGQDLKNHFFERVEKEAGKPHGFTPHITLARIKQWEFQKQEIDETPEINKEISLSFPVESIEVMESELKREGPEYSVLESAPFST